MSAEASSFTGGSSQTSCSTHRSRTSGCEPQEPVRLEVHPLLRKSKFLAVHVDKLRSFVRARGGGGRRQRCLCPLVVIVQCVIGVGQGSARRIPPKVLSLKAKVFGSLGMLRVGTSGRPKIFVLRVLVSSFRAFLWFETPQTVSPATPCKRSAFGGFHKQNANYNHCVRLWLFSDHRVVSCLFS